MQRSQPPELAIFVGLQASGKTTFRERFLADRVVVSKDLMRNVRRKEDRQRALVREALAAGASVVVDNTNPEPEQRLPLIAIAREHGARVVAYYFETSLRDSFRRNAARTDKEPIPRVGLLATAKRLTPPTPDEGFDEIRTVRVTDDGFEERRVHPRSSLVVVPRLRGAGSGEAPVPAGTRAAALRPRARLPLSFAA